MPQFSAQVPGQESPVSPKTRFSASAAPGRGWSDAALAEPCDLCLICDLLPVCVPSLPVLSLLEPVNFVYLNLGWSHFEILISSAETLFQIRSYSQVGLGLGHCGFCGDTMPITPSCI